MYKLSRFLLAIALLEFAYCAFVAAIVWWPWPLLIASLAIVCERMRRGKALRAYGTAQFSSEDDLRRVGMIGGRNGLSIGRLGDSVRPPLVPSLLSVLDPKMSARDACDRFLWRLCEMVLRKKGEVVRLSTSVHTAVFGPTGAGKGASFIIPWLMDCDESAVVLDYKGENASITARYRERKFGQRSVLLDPFHVVTRQPDCLNPIDFILKDSANAIDDCRDLAEQLVVRSGDEREPHWNDSAEAWIAGTIVAVVQQAQSDNRSLQTVRDVLSNPDKIPQLLELLCTSDGMSARLGGQLAHFRDKELSSTLTTANRHLRFLDTPAIAASTCRSSFNPVELRNAKMTVYCILPPEHMRAQSALIRMWVGTLTRAVVRGGLQHG